MQQAKDMTLAAFAEALGSGRPTPGGGGAAALVAVQAAALTEMVAQLTAVNKKYAAQRETMLAVIEETRALREELLGLIDRDAAAFAEWLRIWRQPASEPERAAQMRSATLAAAQAPLAIARGAARLFEPAATVFAQGTVTAQSDAVLSVLFAAAAVRGALYNVEVNLTQLPQSAATEEIAAEMRELAAMAEEAEKKLPPLGTALGGK